MPVNVLKELYYTFIFSYLNYGLMSWGTACQTKLRKFEIKIMAFDAFSLQIKEKILHHT